MVSEAEKARMRSWRVRTAQTMDALNLESVHQAALRSPEENLQRTFELTRLMTQLPTDLSREEEIPPVRIFLQRAAARRNPTR